MPPYGHRCFLSSYSSLYPPSPPTLDSNFDPHLATKLTPVPSLCLYQVQPIGWIPMFSISYPNSYSLCLFPFSFHVSFTFNVLPSKLTLRIPSPNFYSRESLVLSRVQGLNPPFSLPRQCSHHLTTLLAVEVHDWFFWVSLQKKWLTMLFFGPE